MGLQIIGGPVGQPSPDRDLTIAFAQLPQQLGQKQSQIAASRLPVQTLPEILDGLLRLAATQGLLGARQATVRRPAPRDPGHQLRAEPCQGASG